MCLGMNPDQAGARRTLRLDLEPQFRGPPRPGRPHPPDEPGNGGRGGHRRPHRRCEGFHLTEPRAILLAAIISLICGLGCANALVAIWRLNQPLTTATWQVQDIWYIFGSRGDPEGARFTLASGIAWRWNREFRNCEHPAAELKAQRWKARHAGDLRPRLTRYRRGHDQGRRDRLPRASPAGAPGGGHGPCRGIGRHAGLVSGLAKFLTWRVRSKFEAGRYRLDAPPAAPRFRRSPP